ncbi:glycine N-acyltransferase-like [Gastrophryne carolinensis]
MLFLNCPSKLATLRRLLVHNFPESLKACGALQHVINGNPFNLQVLVDQWPDFSTVLCRPALEDMKDPMDHYTNTYFLFSKDLHNLRQLLQDPQAVNWSQNLQIQGCQPALGGVLQEISLKYGTQLQTTSNFLYMKDRVTDDDIQERNSNISGLQFSSLVPEEADIVNAVWAFGGDKNGERYVRRCIQSFPSVCLRKEGTPIAWTMSEQSAEMRMGYTDKQYRNKGIFRTLIRKLTSKMDSLGTPHYCHVAPDNKSSHTATVAAGYPKVGRWQQWSFNAS